MHGSMDEGSMHGSMDEGSMHGSMDDHSEHDAPKEMESDGEMPQDEDVLSTMSGEPAGEAMDNSTKPPMQPEGNATNGTEAREL